jgi:hypothetical protein
MNERGRFCLRVKVLNMAIRWILGLVLIGACSGVCWGDPPSRFPGRTKWDLYYEQQDSPNSRYRSWNPPQYWGAYRGEGTGEWFDRWERRRDLATARRLRVGETIEDWQDVQRAREAQLRELYREPSYDYYRGQAVQPYNPESSSPPPSSYYYERPYRSWP